MRSGPIILLIVALWAAVLVPAFFRRRDDATESRSVDRFTRAMRTLRRDDPLPADDRTILMPRRPAAAIAPQLFSKSDGRARSYAAAPERPAAARPAVSARPALSPPRRPASASLIARRRRAARTLAITVAVTLLIGIVAGNAFFWMLHGLVDGMAAVYVVHLRSEAKRAALLARRRPRARAQQAAPRPRAQTASASATEERAVEQHRVRFEDEESAVSVQRTEGDAGASSRAWQPIPVPVPTYVTAPKAPRRGKEIEVPPSWADGLRDDGVEIDLTALERIEPEIDRMLQRRRAVND
ncbi:MAG: hypothetical protein QOC60_1988 [Frankiaceae bacterium]|nr:hypothetical protein [Frankiaceae bacterium]